MPRVNIGVVIVNWKREESTTEFVDSLKKLKLPKWTRLHKIIIDNESKGKLKRSNLGKSSQINIVEVKENLGFAGGYNIGIKEALKKAQTRLTLPVSVFSSHSKILKEYGKQMRLNKWF